MWTEAENVATRVFLHSDVRSSEPRYSVGAHVGTLWDQCRNTHWARYLDKISHNSTCSVYVPFACIEMRHQTPPKVRIRKGPDPLAPPANELPACHLALSETQLSSLDHPWPHSERSATTGRARHGRVPREMLSPHCHIKHKRALPLTRGHASTVLACFSLGSRQYSYCNGPPAICSRDTSRLLLYRAIYLASIFHTIH